MCSANFCPCIQRGVTCASSHIQDLLSPRQTRKIDQGLCPLREKLQDRLIIAARREAIRCGNRGFVGIKVHLHPPSGGQRHAVCCAGSVRRTA